METERLRLCAWIDADVEWVFDMYSRWEAQRFIGLVPRVMAERSEAEATVARWRSVHHPLHGVWAVQRREDEQLLGAVLLKPIPASSDRTPLPPSGDIEIGWHVHPDAWGHGYAAEAASKVLAHAFASGLDEVVAVTNTANTASTAVARRIGMSHRGQTTRYYNATCELYTVTAPAP